MANDKKYGRLYPERAVAPLRAFLEEIVAGTHWKDAINALKALDELGFPPDEPLFLLRGQDELAAEQVHCYAKVVRDDPAVTLDAEEIDCHADRMARWQPRKLPD